MFFRNDFEYTGGGTPSQFPPLETRPPVPANGRGILMAQLRPQSILIESQRRMGGLDGFIYLVPGQSVGRARTLAPLLRNGQC